MKKNNGGKTMFDFILNFWMFLCYGMILCVLGVIAIVILVPLAVVLTPIAWFIEWFKK